MKKERISITKLVEKLSATTTPVAVAFIKKDLTKRVVYGQVKKKDDLGYLLVQEVLTDRIKKVNTRTLTGAIIDGETYNIKK